MTTTRERVPEVDRDPIAEAGERWDARLPDVGLPGLPQPGRLAGRCLAVAWVLLLALAVDRFASLLMDLWLLRSLGYEGVFWTNLWTRVILLGAGLVLVTTAVALPFRTAPAPRTRRHAVSVGLLAGALVGWVLSQHYLTFIGWWNRVPFGQEDPVFGHDPSFYVFTLPALRTAWVLLLVTAAIGLLSAVVAGARSVAGPADGNGGQVRYRLRAALTGPATRVAVAGLGTAVALGFLLARYSVLTADNYASSIPSGAEHLDVGPLSTVTFHSVTAVVVLLVTIGLVVVLRRLGAAAPADRRMWFRVTAVLLAVLLLDLVGFRSALAIRNMVAVEANEPVVQLPYIERHLEATRAAWGLDDIEVVPFGAPDADAPLPSVEDVLASPAIRSAGLWPGYVSRLERVLDPEYVDRLFLATDEDVDEIYNVTLDAFSQQQKLRPYYEFMDVDTVRYRVDGEPRLFASAVREIPLIEP